MGVNENFSDASLEWLHSLSVIATCRWIYFAKLVFEIYDKPRWRCWPGV